MRLSKDKNGESIQGFAPTEIISVSAGNVDTTEWLAFCFSEDVIYQINGSGETATLLAGSIRVVSKHVSSITFSGFGSAKCEVMK